MTRSSHSWTIRLAFCYILFYSTRAEYGDPLSEEDHFKRDEHGAKYDHEAFLGKDQAAEFDDLTPEQSKERLKKLIPRIDADGDGTITEEELIKHINFMQKRYVQNDIKRTWDNYKGEQLKDGKLQWKDYAESVYGTSDAHNVDIDQEYKKMLGRDDKRWKKSDTDGDGALNMDEYACFMHPEDCTSMRDTVVEETLDDIDKDKDGFVSLEEYIGDMYRPDDYPELDGKEPDWVQNERETFTEQRDKNKDGKLDREEMKDWVMPDGFDHAEAEARHLIHMTDDNKDAVLSEEEILEHHDVFVGSQATDYGEQLQKHDPSEL